MRHSPPVRAPRRCCDSHRLAAVEWVGGGGLQLFNAARGGGGGLWAHLSGPNRALRAHGLPHIGDRRAPARLTHPTPGGARASSGGRACGWTLRPTGPPLGIVSAPGAMLRCVLGVVEVGAVLGGEGGALSSIHAPQTAAASVIHAALLELLLKLA